MSHTPGPTTTLAIEIYDCIASARHEGYTGDDREYVLTYHDCVSIVQALGRAPTAEQWREAGYPYVGSAHIGDGEPQKRRAQ